MTKDELKRIIEHLNDYDGMISQEAPNFTGYQLEQRKEIMDDVQKLVKKLEGEVYWAEVMRKYNEWKETNATGV